MKNLSALVLFLLFAAAEITAQTGWKNPPADVLKIVDAPPLPSVSISPTREAMILTEYNANPSVALLARPFLKLAGIRLDPSLNSRQRLTEFTGFSIQWIADKKTVAVELPAWAKPSGVPSWSLDGRSIAFGNDSEKGVELWLADARTGKTRRVEGVYINDVLGSPFYWLDDSRHLLVRSIPANRGAAPTISSVPNGPAIEETAGKSSKVMTFQDLLKNEGDERLFEFYATSQLTIINTSTNKIEQTIGQPGLFTQADFSPDGKHLLVSSLRRPFSYRVTSANFSRKTEVWSAADGRVVRTIVERGVTDEIPPQGVVTGPRGINWQPLHGSKLVWAEALDGGDPKKKVDFRDKLMSLETPFSGEARELLQMQFRWSGLDFTAQKDLVLLDEYDRDRRWATTWRVDLSNPATSKTKLFDLSVNDSYNDPGSPIYELRLDGQSVLAMDGDWAFYQSEGSSPEGDFPRLDKINLKTGEKQTIWASPKDKFAQFIAFASKDRQTFITRSQGKTEVPNYFLRKAADAGNGLALTKFADPAPQFSGLQKELVKYNRPDGTPLNGTLYLPPGHKKGDRLPLFIWAYPLEYSDASTAGQVRGSTNTFTFLRGDSPLFFLTQGWAVLMDATMPVVGDPETMNNTFMPQITSSGKAAIDYLDSLGIIDRTRVGVGGHSYGAFMTANLLAHSDDYAFGIARSGAYNRSLTPFGFQSERRSFWEAKDIYANLSPFNFADKINEPLLLIHGDADNNPGTFTIQSERLFQAIKGNGGTARLVLLPYESHGYRGRENIHQVLAEMFDWAAKFGQGKKP